MFDVWKTADLADKVPVSVFSVSLVNRSYGCCAGAFLPCLLLGRLLPWASSTPSGLLGDGQSQEASGSVAHPGPLPLTVTSDSHSRWMLYTKAGFSPLYFPLILSSTASSKFVLQTLPTARGGRRHSLRGIIAAQTPGDSQKLAYKEIDSFSQE